MDVTGGAGGIAACLEDLEAVSQVLTSTADTVTDAGNQAAFDCLQIGGCGGLDLGAHNSQLHDILSGLGGSTASAHRAAQDLRTMAGLVRQAAKSYGQADNGLFHSITSAVLHLPGALIKGGERLVTSGDLSESLQQVVTADPELVDVLAAAPNIGGMPLVPALEKFGALVVSDGRPVVVDEHNDVSAIAVTPPRNTTDLTTELSARNDGDAGEISVGFAFGTGGTRHVIVDIPGTKSWSVMHTDNVTSMATNLRAVDGQTTSYERGVLEAMKQAGVTAKDDVMLVGHSEGGMVAVTAARDALKAGQFHVSHVVTMGSPIGRSVSQLPHSVSVLALEESHDIIPRFDGMANPDLPNVTTVTGGPDQGTVTENHNLDESYLPLAKSVDSSDNQSIKAFTDSARGFFDQNLMTTEKFLITREY